MSFNNPLAFNLSKSSATTSTTNTNTTSEPPSNEVSQSTNSTPKAPFLLTMLAKKPSNESSPKFSATGFASSGVAPTVVTIGDELAHDNRSPKTSNKAELIGLFDKFDISKKEDDTESDEEIRDKEKLKDESDASETTDTGETKGVKEIEKDHTEPKEDDNGKQESSESKEKLPSPKEEIQDSESNDLIDTNHQVQDTQESSSIDQLIKREKKVSPKFTRHVPIISESMTIRPYNPNELHSPPVNSPTPSYNEKSHKDLSDITGEDYEEGVEEIDAPVEEYNKSGELSKPSQSSNDSQTQSSALESAHSHHVSSTNINPNEQHQQSHKPFNFQIFLTQLKKKSSDPIVRYIRSFLVSFSKKGHTFTAEQRIKIITEFKTFMYEKFTMYEPFASMDDIDLENSREGLEKLIMNRLYDFCFPAEVIKSSRNMIPESYETDLHQDELFKVQLEKFSWVNGYHLDVEVANLNVMTSISTSDDLIDLLDNVRELTFIDHAIIELNKINNYRAPRDKIICILNACKIIFNFLKVNEQETNADAFIPLFILIIIRAKVDLLLTNLHYIEVFRGEEWLLHGETSYYLSSLQGAITFIQNLSKDDLTISDEEYDAHMEAWDAEENRRASRIVQTQPIHARQLSVDQADPTSAQYEGSAHEYPQQSLSPSNILMTSAEMFTKSISNFLSPSPQEADYDQTNAQVYHPPSHAPPTHAPPTHAAPTQPPAHPAIQPATPQESEVDSELMKQTYSNLKEIFPNLDKSIMKDIILINKGDMDASVDACLELVGE